MPFVQLKNKTKIHYIAAGKGRGKIIFVHGNLANTIWWEETLDKLQPQYQGYALDLPGSGQSPETGERHTMEYLAAVVNDFAEKLGIKEFYLVGHSMGGGIAQLLTLNHPEKVRKLVLLDAMAADGFHTIYNLGLDRMRRAMVDKEFLAAALRVIAPNCKNEKLLARITEAAAQASEQVFLEQPVTMHEANWLSRLQEINCPTLFLHGEEDNFVPQDGSERTARSINGCIFKYLRNCGHSPMLEVFDEYFQEVFGFLG
ncbi:MAG TPA: alpha/beta hydrolase [Smithellaceae bacterium]|nr:alpha/beta hydrolase [Smithellaceae bacterium]